MAKTFELNGKTYTTNLDVNVDAIIEKIKKASAGESVPGVYVAQLPKIPAGETETESDSMSLATIGLLGVLAFVVLKPSRK